MKWNLFPYFHFRGEALQVQDISGRLAISGTVPLCYRLFFRPTKTLPSTKIATPTLSQLVPATKQETSPPRSFAAETVFSVMGVRVSLLCSAMTNVLWNLWSSDAFKERKRGVFYLASKLKTVPKSIQCFRESYQLYKL